MNESKASVEDDTKKGSDASESGGDEEEGKTEEGGSVVGSPGDMDPNLRDPSDEELMKELAKHPLP